ncbi:MAG: ATP-binding cassette domain-containing protein [Bacteroidia bacterium]|nr:ATP-binding cassette domain-containing protein [Bacteroidia bacterium]
MSEQILRALMQLFAIIARVDGVNNTGRQIVQSFLNQQLSDEQVKTYLDLFDAFLEAHQAGSKKKDGTAKRTAMNSVKVLKICSQINQELVQPQKIIVLIRLLEFIYSSNEISEQEFEFVNTVAETFNVPTEEFLQLKKLVELKDISELINRQNFLIIDNRSENTLGTTRHIFNEGASDPIVITRVPSVNLFAMKITGTSDIQINGQLVGNERIHIINPGSSIRSNKMKPVYYSDILSRFLSDESKPKITFIAENVEFRFKGGKLGLRGINISEESGKLIGIMGGSGAGKSTLLNVLNSMEKPSAGSVKINGIDIHNEKEKIEGVIGHVSQDDLLMEELTVFENLYFNAKLCFGNLSEEEIKKRCHELLADLGLSETENLKVGSPLQKTISGGQRKRLNIALELIREPSVLFVDEPTSGLSSRDSENIMDLLKELALKGKLIFVVIHQPSSEIFKMFDRLLILDVGGYPVYYGNPVDAVTYFKRLVNHVNADEAECYNCGNVNPEQIFNIIESKVVDEYGNLTHIRKTSPKQWYEHYKELIEKNIFFSEKHTAIPESIFKIPNRIKQFFIFTHRDIKSKLTNTQYMLINLLEAPLLAFILAFLVRYYNVDDQTGVGYVFRENENIPAYIFMAVIVALFIGLSVSAEEIIRDRKIRKRESFLNLSLGSYLWSKILIMFTLSAFQSLTFVLVGNFVLGIKGMWLDYWLVLFTTSCFANMLGLNISSAFNSAVTIYILIPFLIIPQLLLAGVVVKFDKLNPVVAEQGGVPVAGEVMASRWAFEALAVNQFMNNKYEKNFYKYDKEISIAEYKNNFWRNKIENVLNRLEKSLSSSDKQTVKTDIGLLIREIEKEQKISPKVKCDALQELESGKLSVEVLEKVRLYLKKLQDYYIDRSNAARDRMNKKISSMIKEMGNDNFTRLREEYENESLTNLVKNANDISGERCLEKEGRLIQQTDPVFLDPVESNIGRAHFFAPTKLFLGMRIKTFWFNIIVIWLMSISLIVTLYFDVFRKVIEFLGNLPALVKERKN